MNKFFKKTLTGIAVGTLSIMMAENAVGHSWYDPECCNDKDCAEAEVVKRNQKGMWLKHSKFKSTHFIPWGSSEIRPSQDGKYHICVINEETSEAHGTVMCVYVPIGV